MVNPGLFSANKSTNSVKVSFRIPYFTQWGQSLLVCGSVPVLGSWNVKKGVLLSPVHQGAELIWGGSITVPKGFQCQYSYYVVDDNKNVLRWEMGKKRELVLREGIQSGQEIEFRDLWQTGSDALPFRSAFKDVIFRQSWDLSDATVGVNHINVEPEGEAILVQFKISCPNIEKDTSIYVIGSNTKLGQWKVENGLKLSYFGESVWKAECVMQRSDFPIKYRYGKYDRSGNFSIESGPNREVYANSPRNEAKYIFLSDGMMREIPWRGAGVAVPMFSVRSESDLGVGEFLDLKLLVDWAVASGFHLVQLLPINDTSVHGMWWDSYPYSSLSVFALHPLYLRVQALSKNIPEEIKKEIEKAKQQLDGKDVDYEATMATKLSIAKKVFAQEKDLILNSSSFKEFFSENEGWLKPYAAFCFLRDFFETSDRTQWGCFAHYSEDKLEKLVSKDSLHYEIICFHYYVQYHLHLQLSEAAEYARKKGVILKGDLPIGVDRNSVDTWVYPNLFRMNTSTGAPPDYFDKNGQNWGFPTYNWEEMSKDNYGWWRARLTQMAKYFTAYRIDHILGFFRIWELPDHAATGLVGKFRPSIPLSQEELEREGIWDFNRLSYPYIKRELLQEKFGDAWTFVATTFLKEIDKNFYEFKEDCNTEKKIASKLKTCAESSLLLESVDKLQRNLFDLSQVMQELGLVGLRIQRMPNEPDLEFGIPSKYSYMTVCAPSCHDCSTLRAWWEEDEERRLRFFKNVMESDGLPPDQCVPEVAHFVIRQHFEAPSMWAIFPLQDLLALKEEYTTRPATEETINDPTNPKHYWRFRES
ncbi:hypothetical protein JHK87_053356 [Glycine soja]|nr:hypothetical protein JHK87_053356 [Glycine soja]